MTMAMGVRVSGSIMSGLYTITTGREVLYKRLKRDIYMAGCFDHHVQYSVYGLTIVNPAAGCMKGYLFSRTKHLIMT